PSELYAALAYRKAALLYLPGANNATLFIPGAFVPRPPNNARPSKLVRRRSNSKKAVPLPAWSKHDQHRSAQQDLRNPDGHPPPRRAATNPAATPPQTFPPAPLQKKNTDPPPRHNQGECSNDQNAQQRNSAGNVVRENQHGSPYEEMPPMITVDRIKP